MLKDHTNYSFHELFRFWIPFGKIILICLRRSIAKY